MAGLHSLLEKKWDLKKQLNHHLHIVLTEFSYPIAFEELEVYFSLYSSKESAYVSEKVNTNMGESGENVHDFMFLGTDQPPRYGC